MGLQFKDSRSFELQRQKTRMSTDSLRLCYRCPYKPYAVGKEQGTQDEYDEVTFMKTPIRVLLASVSCCLRFGKNVRRWVGTPAQKN